VYILSVQKIVPVLKGNQVRVFWLGKGGFIFLIMFKGCTGIIKVKLYRVVKHKIFENCCHDTSRQV